MPRERCRVTPLRWHRRAPSGADGQVSCDMFSLLGHYFANDGPVKWQLTPTLSAPEGTLQCRAMGVM